MLLIPKEIMKTSATFINPWCIGLVAVCMLVLGSVLSEASTLIPYSDAGIPAQPAYVYTWNEPGCNSSFNGNFVDPTAPEGTKSFRISAPDCGWIGAGIFKRLN